MPALDNAWQQTKKREEEEITELKQHYRVIEVWNARLAR
jgi:hypothetical protein